MRIELLKEPFLEFGSDFTSDDPKMGISAGGFFSLSNNTHRSELHYAIIGTNSNTEDTKRWIDNFENPIEATSEEVDIVKEAAIIDGEVFDNIMDIEDGESLFRELALQANELLNNDIKEGLKVIDSADSYFTVNKRLNPDFPGFNDNHPFYCRFVNDEANNISIKESQIKE